MTSRRTFLKDSLGAFVCAATMEHTLAMQAENLTVPLGLELYSVREQLSKDYDSTLNRVASLGYREVEAAGFFGHTASQVKQAMQSAGLSCVSALYNSYAQLDSNLTEILRFAEVLGLKFVGCAAPGSKIPTAAQELHLPLTLEDWRWNADQFNRIGEQIKRAGFTFCYHNHVIEFRAENGVLPYDELLRLTDPAKVTMELDCGWMIVGGQSPVKYLTRYPTRFCLLHVKDFKRGQPIASNAPPPPTELGRGSIDYRPIFRAAAKANVQHCFVEQEGFDIPMWESLKVDANYMRNLKF